MDFDGFKDVLNTITEQDNADKNRNDISSCAKAKPEVQKNNDIFLQQAINEISNENHQEHITRFAKKDHNNIGSGHRQRARERFLLNPNEVSDYDLLELILFLIIPRTDTKPMARTLIEKFKTIKNVFQASKDELRSCGVNGEALLYIFTLFKVFQNRLAIQSVATTQQLDNIDELAKYCQTNIGFLKEEEFHILFFNNNFKLLKDKKFGVSDVDSVYLSQREIIKNAIELGANNVVLCHNHPSGDLQPSTRDLEMTIKIKKTFESVSVNIIDHLIVSFNDYFSFYENGLLDVD